MAAQATYHPSKNQEPFDVYDVDLGSLNASRLLYAESASSLHNGIEEPKRKHRYTRLPLGYDKGSSLFSSKRNVALSTLNTVGPLFVLAFYAWIVFGYLLEDSVNGISSDHSVDAKVIFFAWLIVSIFLLEWAKAALAWFESAVLVNYPSLVPKNEGQLLWHLDRGWGTLSGWWRVIRTCYKRMTNKTSTGESSAFPGRLWWFLALNYLLFSVTVPLSGLSMDPKDSLRLGQLPIVVTGVNETTFDVRTNSAVSQLANNNWRTGRAASPDSPAVFYAPEETKNASATYFEDYVQTIYQIDLLAKTNTTAERNVTIFSGPPVSERTHGRAWGFLSSISCAAQRLDAGMEFINSTTPTNWTSGAESSATYDEDLVGLLPIISFSDLSAFGVDFTYVIASDRDISAPGNGEYIPSYQPNQPREPLRGALEIAIWQSAAQGFEPDEGFRNMTNHPVVMSDANGTSLGYGVRCTVESDVGYANLDAVHRTYTNFTRHDADSGALDLTTLQTNIPIYQYPGIFAIQSVVFGALSTVSMGYMGRPGCSMSASDTTCSAFYGANLATGGVPRLTSVGGSDNAKALQVPTITPERMTLAMYKIFGETAAAMMAIGPGNWTSPELKGLKPANELVPGRVPWQLVFVLLSLWAVLNSIPQLITFAHVRWEETLESFAIKKFGHDWRETIR